MKHLNRQEFLIFGSFMGSFIGCLVASTSLLQTGCSKKQEFKIGPISEAPALKRVKVSDIPRYALGSGISMGSDHTQYFEVNIPAEQSSWVQTGQTASVYLLSSEKEKDIPAHVNRVLHNASLETGQALAWLRPDKLTRVPAGEFVYAKIVTGLQKNAISVPKDSVLVRDGNTWVIKKENSEKDQSKFTPRQVELGLEFNDEIEIVSGISTADEILTHGGLGLLSPNFKKKE